MESTASTSSLPHHHHHHHDHHSNPPQPLVERVLRALSHNLRLLHRFDSTFFVLGATGNVYTVTLSLTPSCTCPDRCTPCKHMLFVYIRILGLSLDDTCLWQKTLPPSQLIKLLNMHISDLDNTILARRTSRERFQELFFLSSDRQRTNAAVAMEDGGICPICLEEMRSTPVDKVVACATCKNPIHKECFLSWKNSSRRRSTSCVICRARWRSLVERDKYLNLSLFVSEDENDGTDQDDGYRGDDSAILGVRHNMTERQIG